MDVCILWMQRLGLRSHILKKAHTKVFPRIRASPTDARSRRALKRIYSASFAVLARVSRSLHQTPKKIARSNYVFFGRCKIQRAGASTNTNQQLESIWKIKHNQIIQPF